MELKIDNDLKNKIPHLTPDEYKQLEESILSEGCRDSLLTWNNILIDGHNRYEICTKHGIKFDTTELSFDSRNDAIIWMLKNQLGRRNLSIPDKLDLSLELEPLLKKKANENKILSGKLYGENHPKEPEILHISAKPLSKVDTREELAKLAGVSHDTVAKYKTIKEKAPIELQQKVKSGEVSINQAHNAVKMVKNEDDNGEILKKAIEKTEVKPELSFEKAVKEVLHEAKREKIKTIEPTELHEGLYNVILVDPPWRYDFSETKNREIENQYPTMELDDIKILEVPADDNSVLFMWATSPKLEQAFEVLKAWGFQYKTCAVWDKEVIGMGYWFRGQHELLLVATKGKPPVPLPENRFSSVIREKRTEHSKKPECVYDMIEKMMPNGSYLEMFARNSRDNWESWGNQV
jgi:N6-adenosine-specific RNA methylase IME4